MSDHDYSKSKRAQALNLLLQEKKIYEWTHPNFEPFIETLPQCDDMLDALQYAVTSLDWPKPSLFKRFKMWLRKFLKFWSK